MKLALIAISYLLFAVFGLRASVRLHDPRVLTASHFSNAASPGSVNAFYRANRYKASARDKDTLAVLTDRQGSLVAAVRLVPRACSELGDTYFLRNLCVALEYRRRGLGTRLIREAIAPFTRCFCYTYAELVPLYRAAGFLESDLHAVPKWVSNDYMALQRKQAKTKQQSHLMKSLHLMTFRFPLSIILLQHENEGKRSTATGKLLFDSTLAGHTHAEVWKWSGRIDNDELQQKLEKLISPSLLWTGLAPTQNGGGSLKKHVSAEFRETSSFIVLDGTWQEAQKIFRKGPPILRTMHRLTLNEGQESSFILRGDFGWKQRFGAAGTGDALCTAEVGATLLEQAGDEVGGKQLRTILNEFQRDYALTHPHLFTRTNSCVVDDSSKNSG